MTFSCNATGGLAPYSYEWRRPHLVRHCRATGRTYTTTSSAAGNLQADCSSRTASATRIGHCERHGNVHRRRPAGPRPGTLSANVSASPNPASSQPDGDVLVQRVRRDGSRTRTQWRSGSSQSPGQPSRPTRSHRPPRRPSPRHAPRPTAPSRIGVDTSAPSSHRAGPLLPRRARTSTFSVLDRDNGFIPIPLSSSLLGSSISGWRPDRTSPSRLPAPACVQRGLDVRRRRHRERQSHLVHVRDGRHAHREVTLNSERGLQQVLHGLVAAPSGLFTARYADNSLFSSAHVESGRT